MKSIKASIKDQSFAICRVLFSLSMGWRILLYVATLLLDIVAIWNTRFHIFPMWVASLLYAAAFCSFALTSYTFFSNIPKTYRKVKAYAIAKNRILLYLSSDIHRRTFLFTIPSLSLNFFYAAWNVSIAIETQSAWCLSLAVYYTLLSLMRVYLLSDEWKNRKKESTVKNWKVLYRCGILLIIMSIALAGVVTLMVRHGYGKTYARNVIDFVALYTFCKVISSITSLVTAKKVNSPFMIGLKNISYAEAMLSLFSLQMAMFAVYGATDKTFPPRMNSITGAVICLMIIGIGFWMIFFSKRQIKKQERVIK